MPAFGLNCYIGLAPKLLVEAVHKFLVPHLPFCYNIKMIFFILAIKQSFTKVYPLLAWRHKRMIPLSNVVYLIHCIDKSSLEVTLLIVLRLSIYYLRCKKRHRLNTGPLNTRYKLRKCLQFVLLIIFDWIEEKKYECESF